MSTALLGAAGSRLYLPPSEKLLTWRPPEMHTNPIAEGEEGSGLISANVPAAVTFFRVIAKAGQDVILHMAGANRERRVNVEGNPRNVIVIGGAFSMRDYTGAGTYESTCLNIAEASGEIFIEGIEFGGGKLELDCINAGGSTKKGEWTYAPNVTIQNCRGFDFYGTIEAHHADFFQPQHAINELRMDKVHVVVRYQGIFISQQKPIAKADLRRISMSYDSEHLGYMLWLIDGGSGEGPFGLPNFNPYPTNLYEIYLDPGTSGRSAELILWPKPGTKDAEGHDIGFSLVDGGTAAEFDTEKTMITGKVHFGPPPGGDFVKSGEVGLNYTTPGYLG